MSSHLNYALRKSMGKVKKPYAFASQELLDTPRPTVGRTAPTKKAEKAGYKFPKEPSNGLGVGY